MKTILLFLKFLIPLSLLAQDTPRTTIDLNGTWDFDQTISAFPPEEFTRKITVPGLIHLAEPKIEEYDKFFKRPEKANFNHGRQILAVDYTPRYSWYRKKIIIDKNKEGKEAVLTILKSQYVTQVFVNGIDLGNYIQNSTPIDVAITRALKYGEENEILLKVGDRYWLPSEAAGGTDKEKEHYLPGIWDEVSLSFTDKFRVSRVLALPYLKEEKVTVKAKIWNLNRFETPRDKRGDRVPYEIKIFEKKSGELINEAKGVTNILKDQQGEINVDLALKNPHSWSPIDPFLYLVQVSVGQEGEKSDQVERHFGMRDFERKGKHFYLNGEKTYLRGSNITLQRFFEDPDARNLTWDKEWVKNLFIDISKNLQWNSMRICVGLVPDFWYDLADEHGLLLQNEWQYWQIHGWDAQVRKEYTDWVWADGSHPSIVIWDAINENHNEYIGNTLIPELKELDPTRIWDAGFMTADEMSLDEMDEPHVYMGRTQDIKNEGGPYPLGNFNYRPQRVRELEESSAAQLVNEYGWVWLWRDGTPSKLTTSVYNHYLGTDTTAEERWFFQAYWLQLETEMLRSNRSVAGLLAFTLLTNNYGYTGDWFVGDIKDLEPSPALYWMKHSFAPTNVFINLTDQRYAMAKPAYEPGDYLSFSLVAVNDMTETTTGELKLELLDSTGDIVFTDNITVDFPAADRKEIPYSLVLPEKQDGYQLRTTFIEEGTDQNLYSRRYIKVGDNEEHQFYEGPLPNVF